MHTGSATVPMPSIGAWISYGLGTINPNLPSYVVLCEHLPYAGTQVWDSSFLPPIHQGVRIVPGPEPIPDLRPPSRPATLARAGAIDAPRRERAPCRAARRATPTSAPGSPRFDVARGMMRERPRRSTSAARRRRRSPPTGSTDGDTTSFGYQCLIARRLIERGVRVVELIDTGSNNNWDAHGNMQDHRPKALRVDRAIAGSARRPEAARAPERDAGRDLHRIRPHPLDRLARHQGAQPLRQGLHGLARRRGRQGGHGVRRDGRIRRSTSWRTRSTSTTITRRSST